MNQVNEKITIFVSKLLISLGISLVKVPMKRHTFIILPEAEIGTLLSHYLSSIRSAAFSVFVSSISSTRLFAPSTLDLLKQNLCILHADTDAKIRNETLSNSQKLLERIRGAMSFLVREIGNLDPYIKLVGEEELKRNPSVTVKKESLEMSLQHHKDFLRWYIQFLSSELIPTASYQRHITALKVFQILIKLRAYDTSTTTADAKSESMWPFLVLFFSKRIIRLLLDLVMDPFEDVRAAATEILKACPLGSFSYRNSSGYMISIRARSEEHTSELQSLRH